MDEFLAYLVKNVVTDPESVQVRSETGPDGTLFTIRVAPQDVGKVVGRKGNVIRSLRTLAGVIAARLGFRVQVEVEQPQC